MRAHRDSFRRNVIRSFQSVGILISLPILVAHPVCTQSITHEYPPYTYEESVKIMQRPPPRSSVLSAIHSWTKMQERSSMRWLFVSKLQRYSTASHSQSMLHP